MSSSNSTLYCDPRFALAAISQSTVFVYAPAPVGGVQYTSSIGWGGSSFGFPNTAPSSCFYDAAGFSVPAAYFAAGMTYTGIGDAAAYYLTASTLVSNITAILSNSSIIATSATGNLDKNKTYWRQFDDGNGYGVKCGWADWLAIDSLFGFETVTQYNNYQLSVSAGDSSYPGITWFQPKSWKYGDVLSSADLLDKCGESSYDIIYGTPSSPPTSNSIYCCNGTTPVTYPGIAASAQNFLDSFESSAECPYGILVACANTTTAPGSNTASTSTSTTATKSSAFDVLSSIKLSLAIALLCSLLQ
ncbi:hypothetical protein HK100_003901 [Physocladia obscura]|uniref:Uncharacterized protein n=1 Tax=Physocladia obscura TaxID=109957 RepID=A0AAD5SW43_9FUNG|nr:hypothetical protein HK100_003901 [Physocladia obscura]